MHYDAETPADQSDVRRLNDRIDKLERIVERLEREAEEMRKEYRRAIGDLYRGIERPE